MEGAFCCIQMNARLNIMLGEKLEKLYLDYFQDHIKNEGHWISCYDATAAAMNVT